MQNAVHLRRNIRERLDLAAEEGLVLKDVVGLRTVLVALLHVVEGLAEKPSRSTSAVIDLLAELRINDAHHHPDQRPRRIVLASVASGIPHFAQPRLVKHRKLVPVLLSLEAERLDEVDDLADGIAARELAGHLGENGADAILERIRVGVLIAKPLQSRKQLLPDEVQQFVALQHLLIIKLALGIQRIGPLAPPQSPGQRRLVHLAIQSRLKLAFLLARIKITQKQQPARLLHVIKRPRTPASGLLQDIVNRLENARRRHRTLFFSRILRHLHHPACIYIERP